jgi:hypothetical protein
MPRISTPKRALAPPGMSAISSQTSHSPVELCLCGSGTRAELDDLPHPAARHYRDDGSLFGGGALVTRADSFVVM